MTTDARYKLVVGTVAFIIALPVLGALGTFFLLLIGYYQSPSFDTPFQQAHERAVTTFVESEGFGFSRFRRHDLWREMSVAWEGQTYRVDTLHLVGLTPEKGDRYFDQDRIPKKETLATVPHRQLTPEEAEAAAKLRAGSPWAELAAEPDPQYVNRIRVIAPIFAQKSCLECHEVKEGMLLGAFDYWLISISQPTPKAPPTSTPPAG